MPIDPIHNPGSPRIQSAEDTRAARETRASASRSSIEAPDSSTQVHRLGASDTRRDIDAARVAEIRQGIADGTLHFDTDRIADGLIASARELIDSE